jgi:putative N6-adenine-specific DNA methylase
MEKIQLIATAPQGLEAVVKREILARGYRIIEVENGRILYEGDLTAIPDSNIWLRTADRIHVLMGEFTALTFDELYRRTRELPWEKWIPVTGKMHVKGKAQKSQLMSVSDCQSIVKKAIVDRMKEHHEIDWFEESGAPFSIQIALNNDRATLTMDTSGVGLHKRGYRQTQGEAPMKETLAAALVKLSVWRADRVLLDPFCGSGTIPIEAAMIARNIAPGLGRSFAAEEWPILDASVWKEAKRKAYEAIDYDTELKIYAYDRDPRMVEIAKENAIDAGVDDCIEFGVQEFDGVDIEEDYGVIITNPPYGVRLGEQQEVENLYRKMGLSFQQLTTWSKYIITGEERFERLYGIQAFRNRKLYNGRIRTYYYQYLGPKPVKSKEA